MSDNDRNGLPGSGKDIPPWLQPVPDEELELSFWQSRKTLIVTAGVSVITLGLFIAVLFVLYEKTPPSEPIRVSAPKTPAREKPSDPGGMTIEHRDKEVFDQIDGAQNRSTVSLGQQPEEPLPIPEDTSENTRSKTTDDVVQSVLNDMQNTAQEMEQEKAEKAKPSEPVTPPSAPVKKVANPAPKPQQQIPFGYRVQLGAYGSEASAERAWKVVKAKFPGEFTDMKPTYESVKTGDRTLYRLRVGPLANRAEADKVCLSLKANQQACMVVNP